MGISGIPWPICRSKGLETRLRFLLSPLQLGLLGLLGPRPVADVSKRDGSRHEPPAAGLLSGQPGSAVLRTRTVRDLRCVSPRSRRSSFMTSAEHVRAPRGRHRLSLFRARPSRCDQPSQCSVLTGHCPVQRRLSIVWWVAGSLDSDACSDRSGRSAGDESRTEELAAAREVLALPVCTGSWHQMSPQSPQGSELDPPLFTCKPFGKSSKGRHACSLSHRAGPDHLTHGSSIVPCLDFVSAIHDTRICHCLFVRAA